MPLTKEEIQQLEIDRANAKVRCAEAWQTLLCLEKITKTYFKIHDHWREKFEKADRALAMERRVIKTLKKEVKQKTVKLTQQLTKDELELLLAEMEESDI